MATSRLITQQAKNRCPLADIGNKQRTRTVASRYQQKVSLIDVKAKEDKTSKKVAYSSVLNARSKAKEDRTSKKKVAYSSVLNARSKAAALDIDDKDKDNDLAAVEYVGDIYTFYKEVENERKPQMQTQPEINEKMRSILIDWLVEVHMKFDLSPETLYLTINIIDRFLSRKTVPRTELQLVGVSALLIASKYEETLPAQVNDLVYITYNSYNNKQILVMEKTILGTLEWYLTVPTQYVFLVRFIKAAVADPETENMVHYLAELGTMHYDTLMFSPSLLAASAVYTARCFLKKIPAWTDTLKFHTGYTRCQLMECSKLLSSIHSGVGESKLVAVFEKYSKPKRCSVSLVPKRSTFKESSSSKLLSFFHSRVGERASGELSAKKGLQTQEKKSAKVETPSVRRLVNQLKTEKDVLLQDKIG